MLSIGQGFGRIVQVAYLVEDIDVAMQHWLENAGLGPWTCFRNIELDTTYDGRDEGNPFKLHIHEALAYMGDLQIQLVQSLDPLEAVTPYQPHLERGQWGVHHVAFFAEDIDAAVDQARRQGFDRMCAMRDKGDYRYYYCQSAAMPEVWIEFLESYPGLHKIFEDGIAAAADWDGRDPIRNFEYKDL